MFCLFKKVAEPIQKYKNIIRKTKKSKCQGILWNFQCLGNILLASQNVRLIGHLLYKYISSSRI